MHKTLIARHMREFHEEWQKLLLEANIKTMRRAANEIDAYYQTVKEYKDSQYIASMLGMLEFAIQETGGTKWTVKKAKRDLRGRGAVSRKPREIDETTRQELKDMMKFDWDRELK